MCISPISLQDPPGRMCLWCFASASRVRDPSLCVERITEVKVSGMETYIPHSFLNLNLLNFGLTQPVLELYK
ncbi:hypothetical protein E2C01_075474 [Portunus trituberculatus]|uniref:Uncharacterized protein n=1 Tax=Portunus trituberculatus TaxID=210409 RepID=A0A5B7IJ84_PORTR|nr:hypothetical protein [Portunus trituberculatus]